MLPSHLQDALREFGVELPAVQRVLLVDDEQENLDVLSALLEGRWEVHTAADGKAALRLLEEVGPADLIVADQRMPGMTGVELLERITKDSPDTVRIVLTAYSDVEPMLDAVNRGCAYRFLLKPFDPMEMRAVVEESMRLKSTAAALARLVEVLSEQRVALDRTMEELRTSQDQVIAAERLTTLGRTTSGIVHDLRNGAAILQILVDIVRKETDDAIILQTAETAWASLSSLLELLEQIRDFAQSNAAAAKREATDVHHFLASTLRLFHLEQASCNREITVDIAPEATTIHIDRGRVRQAVMALLRNATRASAKGSLIQVRVRPGSDPHCAEIEVEDAGCGIDEPVLPKVREPFFSAFDPPGLGLGLEIVRLAADAHAGALELDTNPGEGTRARLVLPEALTPHAADEREVR